MALNEKMLPIGKTKTERTGDYLYTMEVVGWNERLRCNVWAEKSKRFWGLESNAMYGIHYDDTADILFDIHQCIRHQLWEDRPESEKSHITVDAYPPMRAGSEPLAIIQKLM